MLEDQWEIEKVYNALLSYGHFYELNRMIDVVECANEVEPLRDQWRVYNKSKPGFNRYGMSLFSLDGGSSGEIDLDSIKEYNQLNNTSYTEMSFRKPTQCWSKLPSIANALSDLVPYLGRSHLIKFDEGGFFPPHRDMGNSFRLLAYLDDSHEGLYLMSNGQRLPIVTGRLYFLNTRVEHSIFNFSKSSTILVLNVEVSPGALDWVRRNLHSY